MPPQNTEAERAVLGAVLVESRSLSEVSGMLRPDDFYHDKHRVIYDAFIALREKNDTIDLVTAVEELRKSDYEKRLPQGFGVGSYLAGLVSEVPTAASIKRHAELVVEMARLRAIIRLAKEAETAAHERKSADTIIAEMNAKANDARRYNETRIVTSRELMVEGIGEIERRYDLKQQGKLAGISTGFRDLDRKLFGFIPQLYLLGGAPSMGKSAIADQFIRAAAAEFLAEWQTLPEDARPSAPVKNAGIITLEMSRTQLALRWMSSISGIPLSRLLAGDPHNEDWKMLTATCGHASSLPVRINDDSYSYGQIERTIDYMVQVQGVRIIEFDYLQLGYVESHDGTREQEVTKLSRLFKRKVKQHGIPIIVISSLNRSVNNRPGDKRPTKSDLRESGNIEFDADVIMFVYREEVYNKCQCAKGAECLCGRRGKAELIVDKGRMEGTGTVELEWHTNTTTFRDAPQD